MSLDEQLQHDINELLSKVSSQEIDSCEFLSECKDMSQAYGHGYGYIIRRVRRTHHAK